MAIQTVDTDKVAQTALKLRKADDNINNKFCNLQNETKKLEKIWKGAAGTAAQTTIYRLFQNNEARSAVLRNYINLLEQQVSPGYTKAETVNKKLADSFK